MTDFKDVVAAGIPAEIPPMPAEEEGINHAPARPMLLSDAEKVLALKNALRYFPASMHNQLAPEFARELAEDGRIYMRRFRPAYAMHARPIDEYPTRCRQAQAIMVMIQNNLDKRVAQHPYELINGGFGMVLDGTENAARRARAMLSWDVSNGLARRAWAGNDGAVYAASKAMEAEPWMDVTLPTAADEKLVAVAVEQAFKD